jgi:TorA maturation chaperone TorD
MTNLTLHLDTPSQRPPATATASAPAVASYTDKDLYTDFTDCFIGKNPCSPCTPVYQKHDV